MPREVSRRTSKPPEQKARVSYPDQVGKRDLDERIVEDRPDPLITAFDEASSITERMWQAVADEANRPLIDGDPDAPVNKFVGLKPVIPDGPGMDNYLGSLNVTEGVERLQRKFHREK
jgi:hypothetical protein